MRILVTGSRDLADRREVWKKLGQHATRFGPDNWDITIVHGGCPTGADQFADEWARCRGLKTEVFPADWNKHGKAAGPIRNRQMVDTRPDLVLAFPKGESRGTRGCVRMAIAAGLPVHVMEAI